MSTLNPWAIYLAFAAIPLIGAFLIRRYRRQRVVSSVVIYRRLLAQLTSRRRFATPQHLVALLLSLLAMAALVMAAMEPQGAEIEPRSYVIVVDTSASMGTREVGQEATRLSRASEALADFTGRVNSADRLALLTAGAEAQLVTGWTTEHRTVVDALEGLRPLGGGQGVDDALAIADAMCQEPSTTEILLVSDGAGLNVPETRCPLRYVRVGEEAANVAITGLTVREADALGLNEIYLALHNADDVAREVTVELALDGVLIDVTTETVPAGHTVERLVRQALPDGDILVARVSSPGENALAADDVAFAVIRPGARVQALLITDHPTTFLAEALRLHPRVDLMVRRPTEVAGAEGPFDLLVVDSALPAVLPEGDHVILFETGSELLSLASSGSVREPDVIRWSYDNPLFRFVNLENIHIASASATSLPIGAESLMDMPDGPLVFAATFDGREMLYFTFHPDRSDLPLRVAFVNLVANLVEWAQPVQAGEMLANVGTGERISAETDGLTLSLVTAPSVDNWRDPNALAAFIGLDARDPLPRAGVYRVETSDGVSRALVAANLFSAAEADLEPQTALGVWAYAGWPEVQKVEAFPWWILVAAALGLLALEWMLPGLLMASQRWRTRRAKKRHEKPVVGGASPMRATTLAAHLQPGAE